jgi:GNAT superfamily N-acetyltransferase
MLSRELCSAASIHVRKLKSKNFVGLHKREATAGRHRSAQFLPQALPPANRQANIPPMDQAIISIRQARPEDAAHVARVYIDSWHDTYAGILPHKLLCAMTPRGQTARWNAAIRARGRESVLVAECGSRGIVGMTSFGPARDATMGFDGEVYTLYVDPSFYGRGSGRALMRTAFATLRKRGRSSCIIWAHAKNPVRFFYEAMGGRLIAERTAQMMGDAVQESAFGWRALALSERSKAH